MGERRGTKALETWCRRVTQGYPGVKVENMTTSWRDGLAFCALIHHFRPDLIDFSRLDKSDVYGNNELAFRIAERHLGIPALLDAEDMAEYPVPDRLSILTYLSQFYQAFASNSSSPVKKAVSDSPDNSLGSLIQGNVQPSPKMEWSVPRREPCAVCNLPVFIAQKLRVGGQLFHRTCFRCARCGAQLALADHYETTAGQFVCETCPDEMPGKISEEAVVSDKPSETSTEVIKPQALASSETPTEVRDRSPSETDLSPAPAPPDPPPSLVAIRRMLFDTDDAKLMHQDVHKLAPSFKKDLPHPVNTTIDKEPSSTEDNFKDSKILAPVNNITMNESANEPNDSLNDNNLEELDVSTTPSFNNNGNINNEEISLQEVEEPSEEATTSSIVEEKSKEEIDYPDDLNPFGSDEEEGAVAVVPPPKPPRLSTNPFGSDSEEEEEPVKPPPRTAPRKTSVGMRSVTSTNPFGSDEEEEEFIPVPTPRKTLSNQSSPEPTPFPRRSKLRTSSRSITSLSSIGSTASSSPRKKRPAPPPPVGLSPLSQPQASPLNRLTPSSRHSSVSSLSSIRSRKTKRAPPPPVASPPRPPPPPSPPKQPEPLPSEAETTGPSESLDRTSAETLDRTSAEIAEPSPAAQQLLSEIEEGMQKLISQHDNEQVTSKELKDSLNESSKAKECLHEEENKETLSEEINKERLHEDVNKETLSEEANDEHAHVTLSEEINKEHLHKEVNKETLTEEAKKETVPVEVHEALLEETNKETVSVEVHKEANKESLHAEDFNLNKEDIQYIDKENEKIKIVVDELHEVPLDKEKTLVEAYNEEMVTSTRNSFLQFQEHEPIHSTPLKKIVPSASALGSSSEEVASSRSLLSSPTPSCSSSLSLSSPPLDKRFKDTANMNKKISGESYQLHKSTTGQWKRKKGPAPSLPVPRKRDIMPMAMARIRQELSDIEIKQQELERQGVALEAKIREKFDSESSITPFLEDLVLQLFELVNEKNDLFRRQAELMYIRRQHQLEEEHAELEFQIRCLMARPEANKTDSDKELEEKLIARLVEVVERRDAIVQCLEMDRLREVEEDKSINHQLDRFTKAIVTDDRMRIKKKPKKKKDKFSTLKSLDLDKDLDESEKEAKKKKKWFTLHHKGAKRPDK